VASVVTLQEREVTDCRLRELMARAQAGDRTAYRDLLGEIVPMVRRAVAGRYRYFSTEDAEDVVQDVLLSLHKVRATFDGQRAFLPWLMAIVHNRAIDTVRRVARKNGRETAVDEYPETFDGAQTNTLDETYGDPEALRAAVAKLPAKQRLAIEMLKLRELTLKEASAESGMSVASLKVSVHRATRALRVTLSGHGPPA
jgi:RNA polymerase sigma-70 factor (ECF subfamily)